jgi:hypothetical protein
MSVGSVVFACMICIFVTYSTPYCNLSELLIRGMYSLFLSYYVYVCIHVCLYVCM